MPFPLYLKSFAMKHRFSFFLLALWALCSSAQNNKAPIDCVNPFIGTTNFGVCHPGAVLPTGLMSVSPFNVMGSPTNTQDKDARWWSAPYEYKNRFFTGYSHVNLSGVGCPDMASLLLMPTSGTLQLDYKDYGSPYTDEVASPGYYANRLTKYGIRTEVSATLRTSIARFTFPAGQANVLLNLGEGLTNESGATLRYVSPTEVEGSKLLGTFCYNNPQAVYPIYFVMRLSKAPQTRGFWKRQRPMTAEAEWEAYAGKIKPYPDYLRVLSGDDIGAYYTFEAKEGEQIEVQIGVSFVSTENARQNLDAEQPRSYHFDQVHAAARHAWSKALSCVEVEGGTEEQRTIFYTALYHTQIHPNILQDVNGQYPAMRTGLPLTTSGNRYTVFSLWDTYRCTHQLFTLLFPERQLDMVRSMLDQYRENAWLPKWELFSQETFTMEGDPAIPVIVDAWAKGLRDFDVDLAYKAMCKGATTPGKDNLLRPDNDDYLSLGYCALRAPFDNSVSHALEYYVADAALARFAEGLGYKNDARTFARRSLGYKHYYSKEFGTLRPITPDGKFYSPFDPMLGMNFEPNPGFHEGNAWNYTFFVPHDIPGLIRLMGGERPFVDKLQKVFDKGLYDPTNEPNIAYPYLFSYIPKEAWRTQRLTRTLLAKHFRNAPDGLPGNDDTGTMSAWAVFAMMGFYPDNPADASYTLTAPVFDKVTLHLDPKHHGTSQLVISAPGASRSERIRAVRLGNKVHKGYRVTHQQLLKAGTLHLDME